MPHLRRSGILPLHRSSIWRLAGGAPEDAAPRCRCLPAPMIHTSPTRERGAQNDRPSLANRYGRPSRQTHALAHASGYQRGAMRPSATSSRLIRHWPPMTQLKIGARRVSPFGVLVGLPDDPVTVSRLEPARRPPGECEFPFVALLVGFLR